MLFKPIENVIKKDKNKMDELNLVKIIYFIVFVDIFWLPINKNDEKLHKICKIIHFESCETHR